MGENSNWQNEAAAKVKKKIWDDLRDESHDGAFPEWDVGASVKW